MEESKKGIVMRDSFFQSQTEPLIVKAWNDSNSK